MIANSVVQWNGSDYRILSIIGSTAYLYPMQAKTISLVQSDLPTLQKTAREVEDPFVGLRARPLSGKARERADRLYRLIEPIVSDGRIFSDSRERQRLIQSVTGKNRTIYFQVIRALMAYWQRGQSVSALASQTGRSSGAGKCGRKAPCERGKELDAHLDRVCKQYLLKPNGDSLANAYRKSCNEWKSRYPSKPAPTLYQLRYYYETHTTRLERAAARNDTIRFNKDVRSLKSTAASIAMGVGSIYEIDSTQADVYLVAEHDRTQTIGRPTIYLVTDLYSGMIVGLHVTMQSACFLAAADTLYAAMASKQELCAKYGISITQSEWPCQGAPAVITADNAELKGYQSELLTRNCGISIHNTASYRGDQKSTVERFLGLTQSVLRDYMTAVPSKQTMRKAGAKDTRDRATLTVSEYTRMLLHAAKVLNTRPKESLPPEYPADEPPTPLSIWNWACRTGRSVLNSAITPQMLRVMLLPRYPASFSRNGISAQKGPIAAMRYRCDELEQQGAFLRDHHPARPEDVQLALDPSDISRAYLFADPDNPARYITCELTEGCAELKGLSLFEAQLLRDQRSKAFKKARQDYDDAAGGLYETLKKISSSAADKKPSDPELSRAKLSTMSQGLRKARIDEHKQQVRVPKQHVESPQQESNHEEPDYRFPGNIDDIRD